jgi:hypothetical protein
MSLLLLSLTLCKECHQYSSLIFFVNILCFRTERVKKTRERTNVLSIKLVICVMLIPPSVDSSLRSIKFSARHACASCWFRRHAVMMVMVVNALYNRMQENTRKGRRGKGRESMCVCVCQRMFIIRRQCFQTAFLSPWLCNEERRGYCDRQQKNVESIVVTGIVLRNKQETRKITRYWLDVNGIWNDQP